MNVVRRGLCGVFCATGATALWAQADEAGSRLAGDRVELRAQTEARGVSLYANYTAEVLGNWRGGFERGGSFEAAGEAGVQLDLQKLAGWEGATVFIGGLHVHGDDPSAELIGDYNYASNIACENTTRVLQAGAGWQRGAFATRVGLLTLDDAFMVSETAQLFINSGFGPMPTVSGNSAAPIWPISAPGIWAEWTADDHWRFQAGAYDGDGGSESSNRHGTTVRLNSREGAMTLVEAARDYSFGGKAGTFTTGVWLHSGRFDDFESGETVRGNEGVYVMIEQHFSRAETTGPKWQAFARFGKSIKEARNTVRLHADVGVSVTELIAGRGDDVAGLAVYRTEFGQDYSSARELAESPATGDETVIEATYAIALGRGVTLQPDLQYIINPHESGRDAFVGILRVSAEF